MCVAIVVPVPEEGKEHTPLTLEELKACESANKAGGGIAFLTKRGIFFKKGITADEMFELQKKAKPPYQMHFRIPTAGGEDKRLCHPFPVVKDANLALEGYCRTATIIHNGHWSEWKTGLLNLLVTEMPGGPWSDTRAKAYIAANWGPETLVLINEKVSLLQADGSHRLFGNGWKQHNGNWFSNMSWESHMARNKLPSQSSCYGKGSRPNIHSSSNGLDIDIFTADPKEILQISEWGLWVGLERTALETALSLAQKNIKTALTVVREPSRIVVSDVVDALSKDGSTLLMK